MKAIIFHGTDDRPGAYWQTWLAEELKKAGLNVETPAYPEINHEAIETFLPKVLIAHSFDENTVLVGHSAGGPLILSILENIDTKIRLAVLVAGYSMRVPGEAKDPVLQDSYDWAKIKAHCQDFVFINSINDPWGCDDKQGRVMFDKLGGTLIIRDEGHFGSGKYNQPYPQLPLVRDLILEAAK
ncbi:MAG TPA: alpha/beta hydrolase [Candidatus Saccharimonadales bacterium]|nr:alpha/beta hydrolase [Candidatus Saccharimonadales bacterium]